MNDFVANLFSLAITVVGFAATIFYAIILVKKAAPGSYRYLFWFSFLLSLWTSGVFLWITVFVNTTALRAQYDVGANIVRPTVFLFVCLTCCKAIVRLFSKGN